MSPRAPKRKGRPAKFHRLKCGAEYMVRLRWNDVLVHYQQYKDDSSPVYLQFDVRIPLRQLERNIALARSLPRPRRAAK